MGGGGWMAKEGDGLLYVLQDDGWLWGGGWMAKEGDGWLRTAGGWVAKEWDGRLYG